VDRFIFPRSKDEKYWLVQLAIGAKRKVIELVKSCPLDMNGISTKAELNVLPLGSYDCITSMDRLDQHCDVL
jgi:hypothetical protein